MTQVYRIHFQSTGKVRPYCGWRPRIGFGFSATTKQGEVTCRMCLAKLKKERKR